jgi:hypothetical protein
LFIYKPKKKKKKKVAEHGRSGAGSRKVEQVLDEYSLAAAGSGANSGVGDHWEVSFELARVVRGKLHGVGKLLRSGISARALA